MSTPLGIQFNENYLWAAILIGILIICSITTRREYFETGAPYDRDGNGAPFIPSMPWISFPEFPAPYRGDQLYLGGSTKCFSCEKDMIKRGLPTYLSHPTKCFDCDAAGVQSYGAWAGHFGQNNKCFSCESQYSPNPFKLESYNIRMPPDSGMAPNCDKEITKCGSNQRINRFGTIGGRSYDDHIENDGVGLVSGFGRADSGGQIYSSEGHEGDQNPIGYTLN
jgi:hypothetical protein